MPKRVLDEVSSSISSTSSTTSDNNDGKKKQKLNTNSHLHDVTPVGKEIIPYDVISNYNTIEIIRNEVLDLVYKNKSGKRHRARFTKLPGPQPASFSRSNLLHIKQHAYYVCEKSDGERMMCYIRNNKECYLIDRKFSIYILPLPNAALFYSLFNQSLVDGELLYEEKQWSLVIFDAILIHQQYIAEEILSKRLL